LKRWSEKEKSMRVRPDMCDSFRKPHSGRSIGHSIAVTNFVVLPVSRREQPCAVEETESDNPLRSSQSQFCLESNFSHFFFGAGIAQTSF
jgi:hypothetical protein